jgi:hypothetical protein
VSRVTPHLLFVLLTMLALPAGFAAWQLPHGDETLLALAGKWFLVWGVGLRLAVAGARQVLAPRLTLEGVFGLNEPRAWPLARELGFWNLSVGLVAVATLWFPTWRLPVALAAGGFYAMAGLMHGLRGHRTRDENTAMASDLAAGGFLLAYAALV